MKDERGVNYELSFDQEKENMAKGVEAAIEETRQMIEGSVTIEHLTTFLIQRIEGALAIGVDEQQRNDIAKVLQDAPSFREADTKELSEAIVAVLYNAKQQNTAA